MRFTQPLSLALVFLAGAPLWAQPQKCPTESTDIPASITGILEYHPGVYAWYGLRPAQPLCGQKVIQLGFDDSADFRAAHRFLGCQVTASGNLFVPATGYWSAQLGITDAHVQPDATCKLGEPLPDYSAVPIPATLHRYRIVASYDPKTETFSAQSYDTTSGKPLSPWQTYATDSGNGARDLQRMFCADGFVASDPKDAQGKPNLQANADPDFPQAIEVAIPNDSSVQLSFVCNRTGPAPKQ